MSTQVLITFGIADHGSPVTSKGGGRNTSIFNYSVQRCVSSDGEDRRGCGSPHVVGRLAARSLPNDVLGIRRGRSNHSLFPTPPYSQEDDDLEADKENVLIALCNL